MPAHCKASMMGAGLTVPITNGRLNLGTWQGIWLCEHRWATEGPGGGRAWRGLLVCVCVRVWGGRGGAPPAKPLLRGCLRDEPECPGSCCHLDPLAAYLQRPRWAATGGGDHPGGRLRCGCGTQPGTATLCWGATLPPERPLGRGATGVPLMSSDQRWHWQACCHQPVAWFHQCRQPSGPPSPCNGRAK